MFKRLASRALTYGPLSFFLLVSLYPLVWLLFYSFKDNEEIFSTNVFGIPPENLVRIFGHGFTTRADGHGFGLHGCALAATEMSGVLAVHSDGPGQGATFTLELPLVPS